MQIVLISGLSGSGKSIALNVLEDGGYYCVDNLPAQLLPETVAFLDAAGYARIAISVDVRSAGQVRHLPDAIAVLKGRGIDVRVLFLEAKTEALVKRFSETRRRHPLSSAQRTVPECIELEREMLEAINDVGHRVDTSDLRPNALRAWIRDFTGLDQSRLTLLFQSFGFKHGIPLDADFVFDVRCLPNPYYDPLLRPLTGKDAAIAAFLEKEPGVRRMSDDIRTFVENWLPAFVGDNRSYLTIALGCTGGQHRSVYFAETLAAYFRAQQHQVLLRHRELPHA